VSETPTWIKQAAHDLAIESVSARAKQAGLEELLGQLKGHLGNAQHWWHQNVTGGLRPETERAINYGLLGAGIGGVGGLATNLTTAKEKKPVSSFLTGALLGGGLGAGYGRYVSPEPAETRRIAGGLINNDSTTQLPSDQPANSVPQAQRPLDTALDAVRSIPYHAGVTIPGAAAEFAGQHMNTLGLLPTTAAATDLVTSTGRGIGNLMGTPGAQTRFMDRITLGEQALRKDKAAIPALQHHIREYMSHLGSGNQRAADDIAHGLMNIPRGGAYGTGREAVSALNVRQALGGGQNWLSRFAGSNFLSGVPRAGLLRSRLGVYGATAAPLAIGGLNRLWNMTQNETLTPERRAELLEAIRSRVPQVSQQP
jgi:hypothetical protein